jgi:hypothetical protein
MIIMNDTKSSYKTKNEKNIIRIKMTNKIIN